jgi:hypothetical protein
MSCAQRVGRTGGAVPDSGTRAMTPATALTALAVVARLTPVAAMLGL